ncbi:uncharacterized protein LOC127733066 isoform X3 [Mytilus californianus]|uniref:uncharacterized protein LOC127733066 isoform X2 n=1 Tax=Mytilus californianus TaxID=6549 RepID=UPI00224826DC|nr:uncharacterized protein LOC127733066 isoform X2 [Mytilus californianus]XP_052098297.1 uncharacterized protein LOC127733066 isoform X3 [Mytilus californianus]
MSYVKFLERFKIFRNFMAEGENQYEIIDNIVQACNVDKASYKIGKTKVFMKENVLETIQKKTTELEKQREKQRINLEREEKQARLRENGQSSRQQDSLGTRNPQNSTKIQKITDDIEITTVQNKTPETQCVNSSPQTSFYVENQMRKNEKKKRIWDVFRNTERDFGDCEKVEKYFLKLCRFFICVGLLFGIAMKGAATILIPLLLSSQLNTEKGDAQQSNALTELILCYSTPIALTFIQSLCKVCFGKVKNVEWKFFLPVLILEGAEVCGTSYLLFNVFCNHSMTSGITFIMTSFTIPSILNILKQIALAREIKPREKNLSKKHSNKFVIRLSRVIIALIAMVIQCGVLVCMIVQPHIIFSDTVSNQIEYTTQEKILIVASLVGVSMGFCQNFLYSNLKFGSFDLKEWRTEVDKARPKINLKLCIVKVGIYLLMAKCLLPEISWTFTEEHANLNDNFIDKIFKIFREHKLMFIYIYCSIFASYEGVLACKLHMQRI